MQDRKARREFKSLNKLANELVLFALTVNGREASIG